MSVTMVHAGFVEAAGVPQVPIHVGFDEWVVFLGTLVIIVLAYGIRAARSRAGDKGSFMQRGGQAGQPRARQAPPPSSSHDQDGGLEDDHRQEKQ